jgi:hypothetical protein
MKPLVHPKLVQGLYCNLRGGHLENDSTGTYGFCFFH